MEPLTHPVVYHIFIGGTIIGAHKALQPMLISEYSDEFELIVVEIKIRNKEIRIISGYGI